MARLKNTKYLNAYRRLNRYWRYANAAFGYLTAVEQWALHDYFHLTKSLTDAALIEHRQEVSIRRPGLPQEAGRALRKLDDAVAALLTAKVRLSSQTVTRPAKRRAGQSQDVHVYGIVQTEVDVEALFQVLLDIELGWDELQSEDADDDVHDLMA